MGEELRVSNPQEFKTSESTRLVKCSSGHVYRIGKMTLPTMAYLSGIDFSMDFKSQMNDPARAKIVLGAIDSIVPECILEPRISKLPAENAIMKEDIPPIDMIELFPAILDLSGYTKEKMAAIEKFRSEPIGKNSEEPESTNKQETV